MKTQREQKARLYALVLGKLVAHHRKVRKLTQQQLANRVGITQPTLSRIERGQSQPDFFTMTELERAFDLQAGKLAQQTEEAVEEARRAAEPGVRARGEGAGTPWWGIALGVAGFAGLVAFAVATLLDGDDEELD